MNRPGYEYVGKRMPDGDCIVTVRLIGTDQKRTSPLPRWNPQDDRPHVWGWGEAGRDAQLLALGLLRHHLDERHRFGAGGESNLILAEAQATWYAPWFTAHVVSLLPREDWAMDSEMIETWLLGAGRASEAVPPLTLEEKARHGQNRPV